MPNKAFRSKVLIALVCASALLSACSVVQVVYSQAPNYLYWRASRAFNLEAPQKESTRSSLHAWFEWNRTAQIPVYTRFLEQARQDAQGDITPALACKRRDEIETWIRTAIDRASPPFARLAVSLSEDQIEHLQDHFKSSNEDFVDDFLPDDPQDRREATDDFAIKWLEVFYGKLDRTQRQQLSADLARMPFNAQVFHQQQMRFQHNLLTLLRQLKAQRATAAQAEPLVKALLLDMVEPQDAKLKAEWTHWIASGCQLSATLHNRSTPTQRRHVMDQFRSWQMDLSELLPGLVARS